MDPIAAMVGRCCGRRCTVARALCTLGVVALGPATAHAADDNDAVMSTAQEPAATTDTMETPSQASRQPITDTVLPLTGAPLADDRKAQVHATSFFDDARQRVLSEARADVRLFGPVSLHGGAFTAVANGYVSPLAGAAVRALSQDRHFVDGSLSLSYLGEGFNLVRAAELRALVGRRFGDTSIQMNAAYAQGLERSERYVDLRISAQQHFLDRRFFVGIDSRTRIDLERDDDEPANEPEMDHLAGPVVGVTVGGVAVSGFGGVSAIRYRDQTPSRVGAFAGIGIGTVLF